MSVMTLFKFWFRGEFGTTILERTPHKKPIKLYYFLLNYVNKKCSTIFDIDIRLYGCIIYLIEQMFGVIWRVIMEELRKDLHKIIDSIEDLKVLRFVYIFISDLQKEEVER